MKKFLLATVVGALTSLAVASVAGACWIGFYQPRVPRSSSNR